jgi:hypothetical protein
MNQEREPFLGRIDLEDESTIVTPKVGNYLLDDTFSCPRRPEIYSSDAVSTSNLAKMFYV